MKRLLRLLPPEAPALLDPSDPISRHARKCSICCHPRRDDIEQDFLRWQSPEKLALAYGIPHHSMIYRHAHALDLFRKRSGLTRHALESIIEQSETCKVTASAVLRAIRAYSCLTDDGRWVDPPKQVVISHSVQPSSPEENLIANSAIKKSANPLKTNGHENS
jgi:hypothetical protein